MIQSRETHMHIDLVIVSVCSVILLTIIFFILGCIFGQLWLKHKQSLREGLNNKEANLQSSHTSSSTCHTDIPAEYDLEMMENVAYGTIK